jgi:hypothetical protein
MDRGYARISIEERLAHIIEMTMEFGESFGRFEDFPQTE